jgi:protein-tyrosine kinase
MPGIRERKPRGEDFLVDLSQLAENLTGSKPADPLVRVLPAPARAESFAECEPPTAGGLFSVLNQECSSEYREQFRLLRTQLLLHRARFHTPDDFRTISVMSTHKGEGKSFTASNLAAVLAVSGGQRVLLIDVDPGSRPTPIGVRHPEGAGLAYALSVPSDWAHATHRVKDTSLYVMGRAASKSSRNMDLEPFPALLKDLREEFEWIVLDGAAFASCPDAQWLAAATDGTLLVVQQSTSSFGAVQESLSCIEPDQLVGVVFNQRKSQPKAWLRVRFKVGR